MYKLIPIVFLLSGCALVNAYTMGKYDYIEHEKVNGIRTVAELAVSRCSDREFIKSISNTLYSRSVELRNYSNTLPNNQEAGKLGDLLVDMTTGLQKAYSDDTPTSKAFCELKLKNVEESAKKIQTVIARKPR